MLYREIIAVCSEIHTKYINEIFGHDAELCNIRPGGANLQGVNELIKNIQFCFSLIEVMRFESLCHAHKSLFFNVEQ